MTARFEVDPARSAVWFEATSSVHPINCQARKVSGFLEADDAGAPATGELMVPVDGMSSGNPLYDAELRRRLDARRNPAIVGRLLGTSATDRPGVYAARAEVEFRGVTLPFEDEVAVEALADGPGYEVSGAHDFDVRDLGIEPPRILMLKVSPRVRVGMRVVVARS